MIPHIIHLCWFGRGKYPQMVQMCVDSWKRILPDYEIMLWNEDTFDVNMNEYTSTAYKQKKWAFISDYARLYALEKFGGVYMDTDLEVIRDFSDLLIGRDFVSSTLEGGLITAGFIAAKKEHPFITMLRKKYDDGFFTQTDGSISFVMNPLLFSRVAMEMYGFRVNTYGFDGGNEFTVYSLDYFMPYRKTLFSRDPLNHKNYFITEHTYAIHHDMGSWGDENIINWWKRAIARQIIPQKMYLKMKEQKYLSIVE